GDDGLKGRVPLRRPQGLTSPSICTTSNAEPGTFSSEPDERAAALEVCAPVGLPPDSVGGPALGR
ncbi:MAG: hypothetical protein PVJ80_15695, partial [Gemmatimonadota bacterium]